MKRLRQWWQHRQLRKSCWHHDLPSGVATSGRVAKSLVEAHLIDLGRRKLFRCTRCGEVKIV